MKTVKDHLKQFDQARHGDPVRFLTAVRDAVLDVLRQRGLLKGPLGSLPHGDAASLLVTVDPASAAPKDDLTHRAAGLLARLENVIQLMTVFIRSVTAGQADASAPLAVLRDAIALGFDLRTFLDALKTGTADSRDQEMRTFYFDTVAQRQAEWNEKRKKGEDVGDPDITKFEPKPREVIAHFGLTEPRLRASRSEWNEEMSVYRTKRSSWEDQYERWRPEWRLELLSQAAHDASLF